MPEIINKQSSTTNRCGGIALLMVLLIVMAITVLSVGFLARADVELSCGANMVLRMQMDQLADSALEHAKGLLLHPQNVSSEYWTGTTLRQLTEGSQDYYDVNIVRDAADHCTYHITCEAYRLELAEKIGVSRLAAEFRLDPSIALWTGSDLMFQATWCVHGDVRAAGGVVNPGPADVMDGDVFSAGLTGSAVGASRMLSSLTLTWPPVTAGYFNPEYNISPINGDTLSNTTRQPAHIWSYNGNLTLGDNVTIDGMLLVNGNVIINGNGVRINAAKNLPALYVGNHLIFRGAGNTQINGLAVVYGDVLIGADTTGLNIQGGLFARERVAEMAVDSSGQGNDAVIHSRPVWRPVGNPGGGALEFDGADDYLQTFNSATQLQLTDAYTLSVWIKPAATQKDWATVLCKTDPNGMSASSNHWTLQFSKVLPRTLVVYHDTSCWDTGITLTEVGDGLWHHVAVVRQADGTMVSYLDSLDGTPRTTMDPGDPFRSRPPGSGEGHLNIGVDRTASSAHVYAGLIGDIRIYDRTLSPGEIQDLSTMKNVTANLIGHWKLDETGSGMTITAEPAGAAIVVGATEHWSQAAGGFFKSIRRE